MKRGLVFGKFMPLHRGHQLMIETALSQVDDLTIVVYDSRRPGDERMPVELRLRWLRELYPNVENICDTNAWTTLHWSLRSYGTADARLHELVDLTQDDYTWFLCANDFGWIEDGTREMAGTASEEFQEQQVRDLERRGIPYVTVTGSVEQRVEQVNAALHIDALGVDRSVVAG